MEKNYGYSQLTVEKADGEKRIISGWASTPDIDRDGDIILPSGGRFTSKKFPLLMMHDHSRPVGTVEFGKPDDKKGIPFTAHLPEILSPSGLAARIEEAWQSVKAQLVSFVSIGFIPISREYIPETGGYMISEWDLLELSLVSVPSNPYATITQVKSFDAQVRESMLGKDKGEKKASVSSEKKKVKTVKISIEKEQPMKISEQLKQFRDTLTVKQSKLVELGEKSADATFDEAQQEEFDTLAAEVEEVKAHIKRLELAEKAAMVSAKPVTEVDGSTEKHASAQRQGVALLRQAPKTEKGIEFARYVMALVKAKGDHQKAAALAEMHFGADSRVAGVLQAQAKGFDMVNKSAIGAGSTLQAPNATWGNALVDYQDFTGDFIDFLRPKTILGKFGVDGIPGLRRIPFNVTIKGQNAAASANWVGEGKAKPVTSMGFNTVNLGWFKVAAIAVLTDELIRFSDPNAETLVRDELARAVVERLDTDFINPAKTAVPGVSPAGILQGVAAIPSVGTDADAIACDLQALESAFIEANNEPDNAVYIMRPGTAQVLGRLQNALGQSMYPGISMRGGTLQGTPVITSNYVPAGTVALVNASDVYLADDGQVSLDASREASILMDTAPQTLMDSTTPTDAELVSMYQTNSVAVRAERYINWARRRNTGVAHLSGVEWTACAIES